MIRYLTSLSLAVVLCVAAAAAPASAQRRPQSETTARVVAPPQAQLHGTVQDDRGEPLAGAVVSALGSNPAKSARGEPITRTVVSSQWARNGIFVSLMRRFFG